ncbi:MAG: hypothetical protein KJ000_35115 [Pirellulaceae bacterium]|nr:hypothetical protein [Pirellulaceae bacterium]
MKYPTPVVQTATGCSPNLRSVFWALLLLFGISAMCRVSASEDRATARRLLELSHQNQLGEPEAVAAAGLLDHVDPFVRGMAEWALAMKVGHENNGQRIVWPAEQSPEWFRRWQSLPADKLVEFDWVRQAVSAGLDRDDAKLLASVDTMLDRARQMRNAFALRHPNEARAEAIAAAMLDLQAAREKLATTIGHATADDASRASSWLAARRSLRTIAMANPAVDFDRLLLATHHAAHTPRNITRTFSWQHKPGGDLVILNGTDPTASRQPLLEGRLGPGHVRGFDLRWDAQRVAFAYARQPHWPPDRDTTTAAGEGTASHELRKTHPPLQLFEIAIDGAGTADEGGQPIALRQLTDDPYWNDFEPTYCPDGSIVFASDRCGRAAECGVFNYDIANPNLYRLSATAAGSATGISPGAQMPGACATFEDVVFGPPQRVTDSKDLDRHPYCLNDGRVVYTHWEYQERHFMEVHSLWTVRPDGRMSDALFKQHMKAPLALRSARPVPRSSKLVAIATGHHTFACGSVVLIDPSIGMNDAAAISVITPGVRLQEGSMAGTPPSEGGVRDDGGLYTTPCALSEDCFLASYAYARPKCSALGGVDSNGLAVYLIDVYGNRELIYRDLLLSSVHAVPVAARPLPDRLPELAEDRDRGQAVCYVSDVYEGLDGIPRGTARYLRISQHVGWPLDAERGMAPYFADAAYQKQFGYSSWSPVRVIGTVPVHEDGSASFYVPADTAVYFQLLDERFMELRRMRSFVSLQHGETRGCRGCHESQGKTPPARLGPSLAMLQPPEQPAPPPWGSDRLLGYEWLVQPVLDRHCVSCHGAKEPDGGIDLSGLRAEDGLLRSYRTMFGGPAGTPSAASSLVSVADRFSDSSVTQPKQFGSHRSRLITVLREDPLHVREVRMDEADWISLVTWIDCNAPYYDRFINKRPGDGGRPTRDVDPSETQRLANHRNP